MATKQFDDIMECSICREVYTDPRVLPCVHTYCLKCIRELSKDKRPGDKVACPLCRKQFTLPSSGVKNLPKNFFVANFLEKYYCFKCQSTICVACNLELHNSHKCSDINKVQDDFCKQMTSDVDNMVAGVVKCREMLDSLEKEKNKFVEQVEKTGIEISEKAEQLKQMIDSHREKLMNELSWMKQKRMKEIESLREQIERQLLSMESYKKYVDEVRQKGTACDIARAASGLHDRADELLKFDVIDRTLADLGHAGVSFTSSDFVVNDVSKTLGRLTAVMGNCFVRSQVISYLMSNCAN